MKRCEFLIVTGSLMEKLKEIDDDICADAMGVVVFGRRREPRSLNALKRRCKSPSASENFPRGKLPKTKGGRKKVECNDVTERATILEYQAGLDVGGLVVKFDIHAVDVEVEDENHSANKLSRLHPNASSDQNCHQSHGILAHIQVTRSRYLISASISPSHRRTLGISSWAAAASSFVQRSNNLGGRFDEDKNSLDLLFRGNKRFDICLQAAVVAERAEEGEIEGERQRSTVATLGNYQTLQDLRCLSTRTNTNLSDNMLLANQSSLGIAQEDFGNEFKRMPTSRIVYCTLRSCEVDTANNSVVPAPRVDES